MTSSSSFWPSYRSIMQPPRSPSFWAKILPSGSRASKTSSRCAPRGSRIRRSGLCTPKTRWQRRPSGPWRTCSWQCPDPRISTSVSPSGSWRPSDRQTHSSRPTSLTFPQWETGRRPSWLQTCCGCCQQMNTETTSCSGRYSCVKSRRPSGMLSGSYSEEDKDLLVLARRVDALITTRPAAGAPIGCIGAIRKGVKPKQKPVDPAKPKPPGGWCWYHQKHREAATNCKSPCTFPSKIAEIQGN